MFSNFDYLKNVFLKDFSTIKIGGKINYIIFPKNSKELIKILKIIKKNRLKWFVLGNGSNILFNDSGFDGVAISLKHFNKIVRLESICKQNSQVGIVKIGAGANAFVINAKLKEMGLSGMEWSFGIPASIGGMVVGNAGSFGHEFGEYVEEVEVLDLIKFKIIRLSKNKIKFEYRNSNLRKYIVLSVILSLKVEKSEIIEENMKMYFSKKKYSQPYGIPSLGSVFKIIQGDEPIYPAKLIDKMGLKGVKIGGAEISTKHAGFIVNTGNATSKDVLSLIDLIKLRLSEVGVQLEEEIIIMPK